MHKHGAGFTLLELLLVLVLIGVLASVMANYLAPLRTSHEVDSVVTLLSDKIIECQDLAGYQAQIVRLHIDLQQGDYAIAIIGADSGVDENDQQTASDRHGHLSSNQQLQIEQVAVADATKSATDQAGSSCDLWFFPDRRGDSAGVFKIHLADYDRYLAYFSSGRSPQIRSTL